MKINLVPSARYPIVDPSLACFVLNNCHGNCTYPLLQALCSRGETSSWATSFLYLEESTVAVLRRQHRRCPWSHDRRRDCSAFVLCASIVSSTPTWLIIFVFAGRFNRSDVTIVVVAINWQCGPRFVIDSSTGWTRSALSSKATTTSRKCCCCRTFLSPRYLPQLLLSLDLHNA